MVYTDVTANPNEYPPAVAVSEAIGESHPEGISLADTQGQAVDMALASYLKAILLEVRRIRMGMQIVIDEDLEEDIDD